MIGSTRYIASVEIARQARLSAEMTKLQTSISTDKRLSAASDDPAAAARIADIRQSQADHAVWARNADTGAAIAGAADDTLTTVATALDRAKELVLAGRNDATAVSDRAAQAAELRGIAQDLTGYAAATDGNGRALFPADPSIAIPVSDTLAITASSPRDAVFGTVATASGPKSLADILNAAADALEMGDGDSVPTYDATGAPIVDAGGNAVTMKRGDAITAGIAAIDAGVAHIGAARTDQGIRAARFDDAKARLASSDTDLATERSSLEDTDLAYALSRSSLLDTQLKAAQAVFAQSHKSSLFDLLG